MNNNCIVLSLLITCGGCASGGDGSDGGLQATPGAGNGEECSPPVNGSYESSFVYVDGDCAQFAIEPFEVAIGPSGMSYSAVSANGGMVVTDLDFEDCALDFSRQRYSGRELQWTLRAELDVVDATQLQGTAFREEYDDTGTPTCSDNFEVVLSLLSGTASGS